MINEKKDRQTKETFADLFSKISVDNMMSGEASSC